MNGAEAVAEVLGNNGIDRVWCFPGGTISPLLDAIDRAGIQIVTARNEAGAGHMAQAAWRVTGVPQVVLVTSGPGVTNVITPVADAYFDSDALVVLTGQVSTDSLRGMLPVRQRGFQETDTMDLMRPITKHVSQPTIPDALPGLVLQALNESKRDRPGPCVIDCPMDVQREEVKYWTLNRSTVPKAQMTANVVNLDEVNDALSSMQDARTPVVLAGRGSLASWKLVREFIGKYPVEIVASLPAVGISATFPYPYRGMVGHTGHEKANEAIAKADCILVLGARLDIRQTGTEIDEWERKTIIRVDFDRGELENSRVRVDHAFDCDVQTWLEAVVEISDGYDKEEDLA